MGTPSRQIGWSTEANLLHSILRQLDQLAGVIAVSGGGGLGNFVTLDTVQPIVARKDFTVVAGPAATFTSSTGNTVNVTATTGSGVYSTSVDGPGIEGFSVNDPGIFGYSSNEPGVFSHSQNSTGFIVDSLNAANANDLAHFRAGGTPVVRIAKNGDVLIGTTYNGYKLDVQGIARIKPVGSPYTDVALDAFNFIARGGGVIPILGTRTSNTASPGFTLLAIQSANVVRTAEADMFFRTGIEVADAISPLTATGNAFQFINGTTPLLTILRNGKLGLKASTTLAAALNLPVGVAPAAPVDGDIWLESTALTGLKIRLGGVTRTITLT